MSYLPSNSRIHPVFHASQIKRSIGTHQASNLPPVLSIELDLMAKPKDILDLHYNAERKLEILVAWTGLPATEATWEDAELIHLQFPAFHLEDQVILQTGGVAMPLVWEKSQIMYQGRNKDGMGKVVDVAQVGIAEKHKEDTCDKI